MIEKIFSVKNEGNRYTRQGVITLFGNEIRQKIFDLPQSVTLDICTLCQLKCPSCYMRVHDYCGRGAGWISFETFKDFIDKHRYIKRIEISNNGEIFLNPDLLKIMEYAHSNGVSLTANTGTNFNFVSDEVLEGLVKYQLSSLQVSADGASQETYSVYRINGSFDTVISNMRKLVEIKKKYNSQYPDIRWQYVVMTHNVRDIPKAKMIAQELGIRIWFKLSWDANFKTDDAESVKAMTGLAYLTRDEYSKNTGRKYLDGMCLRLWKKPVINYDGTLVGCDCEPKKDYGVNVFKVGLEQAMKNENYVYSQQMLMGESSIDKNNPCANCAQGHYEWRLEHGNFINPEDIESSNREIDDYEKDESIFNILVKNARVAIYGSHSEALKLKRELKKKREDVQLVCFLNSTYPGQVDGFPIYQPLYFIGREKPFDYVIISSYRSQESMRQTLTEIGVGDSKILDRFIKKGN